jgi:hypothetical protein
LLTDSSSPFGGTWSAVPAGTYSVTAVAYDLDGGQTRSAPASIVVAAVPVNTPWMVVFAASADHATTKVTSYVVDVFASGANVTTATPLASINLGKPTPNASGDISVDETTFLKALAVGNYLTTVSAVGPGGKARSAALAFSR